MITHKSILDSLIDQYMAIMPHRSPLLFSEFLKHGYEYTTLSLVADQYKYDNLTAKIMLGMLITVFDDLADNPDYFNPQLLKFLYQLNGTENSNTNALFSEQEQKIITLSENIIKNIKDILKTFPHWSQLQKIFLFDIGHIYLANQYAELLTAYPWLCNLTETKLYGPYNMGMVATGMIDMMATKNINLTEIGRCREVFLHAQRLGRIGNLLATFEREQKEHDQTNEIAIFINCYDGDMAHYKALLEEEHAAGILAIQNYSLESFNTLDYAQGLEKLFHLHLSMTGII